MEYKLKFKSAAAKDLYKLTKKNKELGKVIINHKLPEILNNPLMGRMKRGDLINIRSHDFNFKGVNYRILYEIDCNIVRIYATGIHDVAYRKAKSRK